MEALEKLQAEVDALKDAGEVSKNAFDTFCEETKESSEESSKKQQDQATATDDLKQEVVLLSDKVKEDRDHFKEENGKVNDILNSLKEDLEESKRRMSENITEETVKVLNIVSETKMELKTDQENLTAIMTADRENMMEKFKETDQMIENLSVAVQDKMEENLKMIVNRYLIDFRKSLLDFF